VAASGRSTFLGDLRVVLAERGFRRLLATRLVSQTGDGIITAGAAAFAALYLPYSLIGPFAGVLIDRWSRRQILVWSAVVRAAFVVLTAALMAAGSRGAPLYVGVLLVLGVNRFFLSALSAALPHVVAEDNLVMANSVSPTAGGIMATLGGIVALGLNVATGNTERGAAVTLLVGGGCYVAASVVAASMGRDLLGPVRAPGQPAPVRLLSELGAVAAGLVAGVRYVLRRRGPAAALGATGGFSFLFGPLFLMSILLYRDYFYRSSVGSAEGHLGGLVIASGIGYACAAVITPPVTRRLSKPAWITVLLLASAVLTVTLGETFNQLAYLAIGFGLYLTRQGIAICAVTILQQEVTDEYRGRVFAFYDLMSNVPYVAGAALSAAFMPSDGHSPAIVALVAAGFAILAGAYWLARPRRQSSPGPSSPGPSSASGTSASGTSASGTSESGTSASGTSASGSGSGSGASGTGMPSSAAQPSSS
jgi:hypothetical protein